MAVLPPLLTTLLPRLPLPATPLVVTSAAGEGVPPACCFGVGDTVWQASRREAAHQPTSITAAVDLWLPNSDRAHHVHLTVAYRYAKNSMNDNPASNGKKGLTVMNPLIPAQFSSVCLSMSFPSCKCIRQVGFDCM